MLRVAVLGSTGSIGKNTLDVIAHHPDKMQVVALAAGSNWELLAKQALIFRPSIVSIGDEGLVPKLKEALPSQIRVVSGQEGLNLCATDAESDAVVVAVVGARGLAPTYAAAVSGKRICLANKEALVAGGALVMEAARRHNASILPVDSEHSAIFQCLQGQVDTFSRIYLTASGGPFRATSIADMHNITPKAALQHPTWSMGGKITIDSATLMNKGLEVIEAHWLFGADWDVITVVVHPQSIVHSMVEFADGSILAQLGAADMRLPIQVALLHPERVPSPSRKLNPLETGTLTFEQPDFGRFPCLNLAYEAGRAGGTMSAVLNAANEVAVDLFLRERIGFCDIPRLVEAVMLKHHPISAVSVDECLAIDVETRRRAYELAATLNVR